MSLSSGVSEEDVVSQECAARADRTCPLTQLTVPADCYGNSMSVSVCVCVCQKLKGHGSP